MLDSIGREGAPAVAQLESGWSRAGALYSALLD